MRLAYVINSLEAGGAQYPIARIFQGLRERGVDMTVYSLSRRDGLSVPSLQAAGVTLVRAELDRTAHLRAARWLGRELRRARPDAMWTSLTQATLIGQRAGRRLGVPVVSWQHNAFLKPANRWLLRRQRRLSDFWVADSQHVAAFTQSELGVDAKDIVVLPLFTARPDAPQVDPTANGPIRVVSVGRLHRNKGYDLLLQAVASAPRNGMELHIAGDGPEREALEGQIDALGLRDRVTLHGHRSDIPAFLASGDVYVQSSRNEGLCIAAHQAMQAGLPCLVTRVGQLASLPDTLGPDLHVVKPGCPAALQGGLDAMLCPQRQAGLADSSRRTLRNYVLKTYGEERFDAALDTIVARLRAATHTA